MTALITGGLGFVGRHLGARFAARGREAVLLDVVPAAGAPLPEGARAVRADVRDAAAVDRAFREAAPEIVVHAAAQLPLARPDDIWSTNLLGTRLVLEAAERHRARRVVVVSSTAVYPPDPAARRDEAAPLAGLGPYAAAKIEAERVARDFARRGLPVTVVRPAPTIGPGRLGIFRMLFDWVREGRPIPTIGAGDNRYQLLAVDDLGAAVDAVIAAPDGAAVGAFNVGAAEIGTVRADLGALCAAAGTGARVVATPAWAVRAALGALHAARLAPTYPWLVRTASLDCVAPVDRLRALGWRPSASNAGALIQTYRWFVESPAPAPAGAPPSGHLVPWEAGALGLVKHVFRPR